MSHTKEIKPIAIIRSDFVTKFGIPRQSGLIKQLKQTIIFKPQYRDPDFLRGIEGYSHIWLIWGFSEAERDRILPTVRPPRLGGNKRMGVFATRSPFRPNSLGLSAVKLERVIYSSDSGPQLIVSGADLMDGTPIYDIKPYLAFTDSHSDATGGFSDEVRDYSLQVEIDDEYKKFFPGEMLGALLDILRNDPRPAYQNNSDRVYGFKFGRYEIKFNVGSDRVLRVCGVDEKED
ncbi:MAG: tRNA (N6-threonylcarbamoyladenosine(37)-N6)-methyltransferase TrmO [bacterium]|nr:tRNA (N6-threonylcarbamoyladenosine(37)-N6)-methyltransferase TrmO [bacterium]